MPKDARELKNALIAAGGGTAALYSVNAVQIIGADDFIDVGGQIMSLRCAANHIAVLRIDSAGTGAVLVYNKSGELVDIIEQKDDIIIDCGFYDSSGTVRAAALLCAASSTLYSFTSFIASSPRGTNRNSGRVSAVE